MTGGRIFIFDDYYPEALVRWEAENQPLIDSKPRYAELRDALMSWSFGTADFWSRGLRGAGWDAQDYVLNFRPLIDAWERESGGRYTDGVQWAIHLTKELNPDVVLLQNLSSSPSASSPSCAGLRGSTGRSWRTSPTAIPDWIS